MLTAILAASTYISSLESQQSCRRKIEVDELERSNRKKSGRKKEENKTFFSYSDDSKNEREFR